MTKAAFRLFKDEAGATDLPLNFHPAAVRASANVTPFGAMSVPAYAAGVLYPSEECGLAVL
jgi:hypothetical protein